MTAQWAGLWSNAPTRQSALGPSRASGRDVNRHLMGMFAILFFLPEEKKWEVQNNSFTNHLFNSSVEKRAVFFVQRGLGQKLWITSDLGCMCWIVPVLIHSVFSVVFLFRLHLAGEDRLGGAMYEWGSASMLSPQSRYRERLQNLCSPDYSSAASHLSIWGDSKRLVRTKAGICKEGSELRAQLSSY